MLPARARVSRCCRKHRCKSQSGASPGRDLENANLCSSFGANIVLHHRIDEYADVPDDIRLFKLGIEVLFRFLHELIDVIWQSRHQSTVDICAAHHHKPGERR